MNKLIHTTIHIFGFLTLFFGSEAYAFAHQRVRPEQAGQWCDRMVTPNELSTPIPSYVDTLETAKPANGGSSVLFLEESPTPPTDSSGNRTFLMQGITITSARVPQTVSYSPLSVTVRSRPEIESSNATSLAHVVSTASGVFIKDYGAGSGLKTISQRGLGTEHTLILLNGLRVSSMQNGLVDLGLMSVDDMESVEIVRGGQSALYGADAVAGIINVVSRPAAGSSGVQAQASVGSFGYHRYHFSGNLVSGVDGIRLSYSEERSEDDFRFRFHNGPTVTSLKRKNSDLFSRSAGITGAIGIGAKSRLLMVASTYSSERGVGGVVVSPSSSSRARQTDTDHLVQTSFSTGLGDGMNLVVAAQIHSAYERYHDRDLNIGGRILDTYFRNDDLRVEPHIDIVVHDGMRIAAGTELVSTTASGNSLEHTVTRKQLGTFLASQFVLMRPGGIVEDVSVFPSLRCDLISSATPTWSPQFGALVGLRSFEAGPIKAITPALRTNLSRNFRMPTFNELYFNGGGGFGNPGLRPERSTSVDVGASLQFLLAGDHHLQATFFVNEMDDRIVWVPAGAGSVAPKNLRRVHSEGFETSYRWDAKPKVVSFQASYTSSDSRKASSDYPGDPTANKQLLYIPQEMLSLTLNGTLHGNGPAFRELGLMITSSYVGFRYHSEDNAEFLPSHQLWDVGIRCRLAVGELGVLVKCEVNNLFNQDYRVIPGFPMPMRSFRATMGIQY